MGGDGDELEEVSSNMVVESPVLPDIEYQVDQHYHKYYYPSAQLEVGYINNNAITWVFTNEVHLHGVHDPAYNSTVSGKLRLACRYAESCVVKFSNNSTFVDSLGHHTYFDDETYDLSQNVTVDIPLYSNPTGTAFSWDLDLFMTVEGVGAFDSINTPEFIWSMLGMGYWLESQGEYTDVTGTFEWWQGDGFTEQPQPSGYCSVVVPAGAGSEGDENFDMPQITIGEGQCYTTFGIVIPMGWTSVLGLAETIPDIGVPSFQICLRPVDFGVLALFGLQIDLDWMAFVMGAVLLVRMIVRS
jgi:hypothetical protein